MAALSSLVGILNSLHGSHRAIHERWQGASLLLSPVSESTKDGALALAIGWSHGHRVVLED